MRNLVTKPISSIADIISGGTPKTNHADFWGGNIPWLSVKDFNNGLKYVYDTEKSITQEGLDHSAAHLLEAEDIVLSARGTVGAMAKIPFSMTTNQSCFGLRAKPGIDQDYLYYALKNSVAYLKSLSQGSVFSTINRASFDSWMLTFHSNIQEQIAISSVLSALDEKIETNTRTNDYLAKYCLNMAKNLYFGYESKKEALPNGWKWVEIQDIAKLVIRGITPMYQEGTNQLVLGQTCVRNNLVLLENGRYHKPKKITEQWLKYGDLLVNSTGVGSLGRTAQIWFKPVNLVTDSHITVVRASEESNALYLGFWAFAHERLIESLHTGSTGQTELPRDQIKSIRLVLPDNNALKRFNSFAKPATDLIVANQREIKNLSALRDALLPKLMSGEIDVSQVELGS